MSTSVRVRALAVLALAALTFSLNASDTQATPPPNDVVVTNTAAEPVPVEIVLSTGPLLTRNANEPTRRPFQAKVRIEFADGECCQNGFVTVPAGHRLVIEYASALGLADPDQQFSFEVGTRINGNPSLGGENHYLPVLQRSAFLRTRDVAGQAVRIYADPGGSVMLRATREALGTPGAPGNATAFMTISGHLVPQF